MIRGALVALFLAAVATPAIAAGRGYLGVAFADLPSSEKQVQSGALVGKVFPGGAAQRAGLKPGEIVTQINGIFVANANTAIVIVGDHLAGDKITLTVMDIAGGGVRQSRVIATLAANTPKGFAETTNANSLPPHFFQNLISSLGTAPSPSQSPPHGAAPAPAPVRMASATPPGRGIGPAAPVSLQRLQSGACSAMAPQGWQVTDTNPQSSFFAVAGDNMRASYMVAGVSSGQAAGYYGPQFRNPEAFAQFVSGSMFRGQAIVKAQQPMSYGFQLLTWETQNGYSGYAIFKGYALPSDPGGYIVSMYIGGGSSSEAKRLVPLAEGVAATIRCTTQLRPPPPNDFQPARGATCFGSECSEGDAAGSDFNSILGTGYAHDFAGNNYYVGGENWIENGTDGPGYYKQNGNDITKLDPGLQ